MTRGQAGAWLCLLRGLGPSIRRGVDSRDAVLSADETPHASSGKGGLSRSSARSPPSRIRAATLARKIDGRLLLLSILPSHNGTNFEVGEARLLYPKPPPLPRARSCGVLRCIYAGKWCLSNALHTSARYLLCKSAEKNLKRTHPHA